MSPINSLQPISLREAQYELSMAQTIPDAKVLDEVVRRHPQYAAELTEFAIALALDALKADSDVEAADTAVDLASVSPAVSRALSRFQNRLYEVTKDSSGDRALARESTPAEETNPLVGLSRDDYRGLVTRLGANSVFINKLRDRQINPSTITSGFRSRLAEELEVPVELVAAHLAARQPQLSAQFFKAEEKPSLGRQQTFAEAVSSSGLSTEQQKKLLEL